jgi:hypothetical protein
MAAVLLLARAATAAEAPAAETFEISPGNGKIEEFSSCELGNDGVPNT